MFFEKKKLKEDLKWIDVNIPTSVIDKLLLDEDEERTQIELERSKML